MGVLADSAIREMIDSGAIRATVPVIDAQVQPASLDLRLGNRAWRVRASFLTGDQRTVHDRLSEFEMHQIDLTDGAVLEKGCVYVV
uniref:2'-deoxycytidine 5'-triphosphate deaminase domain-containing protein n=1 Tax=Celeribacter marinus TaxID=1397108 RepID=UPI003F6BD731